MNDNLVLEPARSFDIGTYIWAIDCKLDGPEMQRIKDICPTLNPETASFGHAHIKTRFDLEHNLS